jgi:hypothetical protein
MASHRRHSLSILLIVSVVFALPSAAQATDALALELLNRIRAQDFGGAARLFHYPQNQSPTERNADRAGVVRWMQTLSAQLGPLQSFKPHQSSSTERILSLSSGPA